MYTSNMGAPWGQGCPAHLHDRHPLQVRLCPRLVQLQRRGGQPMGAWLVARAGATLPTMQAQRGSRCAQACLTPQKDLRAAERAGQHPTCCGDWSMRVMLAGGMPALTTPCVQKPVPPPTSTTCSQVGAASLVLAGQRRVWRPATGVGIPPNAHCCSRAAAGPAPTCLEVGRVQLRHRQRVLPHVGGPVAGVHDVVVHLAGGGRGGGARAGVQGVQGVFRVVGHRAGVQAVPHAHVPGNQLPTKPARSARQGNATSGQASLATGRHRTPWPRSCAAAQGRRWKGGWWMARAADRPAFNDSR